MHDTMKYLKLREPYQDTEHDLLIKSKWRKTEKICEDKWDHDLDRGYISSDKNKAYSYQVIVDQVIAHNELRWCGENCSGKFYRDRQFKSGCLNIMVFELEEDAILFRMAH